jgi:hypothetical protein
MRRWIAFILGLALIPPAALGASPTQVPADEQRILRERVEARFDVVPLGEGVALRPKRPIENVRLIEISDAGVAINGESMSGRELRTRLGSDADLVLRLSYLSAADRRSVFAPRAVETEPQRPPSEPTADSDSARNRRHSSGDRVRVFGNVRIDEGEAISGQAVAVIGSVRIDGEVGDQVVAVLGSVELGPNAVVRGDVVSVGGTVHRAPGAQIRGSVTEVALGDTVSFNRFDDPDLSPWIRAWLPFYFFNRFAAVPRLVGSVFRLGLLIVLAMIVLVLARPTVERATERLSSNPVKALVVGLLAQVLVVPVLIMIAIVLAISIVGIPLLFLMPFAVLLLVVMALAGFTGTACAVGQWARRRFGIVGGSPFFDVCLGIVVILLPLLVGRILALAGWPLTPVVFVLIAAGFGVEVVAWSSGFGAVLTNVFAHWQARREARRPLPPAA